MLVEFARSSHLQYFGKADGVKQMWREFPNNRFQKSENRFQNKHFPIFWATQMNFHFSIWKTKTFFSILLPVLYKLWSLIWFWRLCVSQGATSYHKSKWSRWKFLRTVTERLDNSVVFLWVSWLRDIFVRPKCFYLLFFSFGIRKANSRSKSDYSLKID